MMDRPSTEKFTMNGAPLAVTKSKNRYLNDNDEPVILYIQAPTQRIGQFGIQYNFAMGAPEEVKKNILNAEGMQLHYPLTSMQTVKEPTPEETAFRECLDKIWKLTCEHAEKMWVEDKKLKGNDRFLNGPSRNSISSVMGSDPEDRNWKEAVKFPYSPKKTKDGVIDHTKPLEMYMKMLKTGKKEKLNILTRIYAKDEDGEMVPHNATQFVGRQGMITPVVMLDDTFWGAHGTTSVGVSCAYTVVQADFEEMVSTKYVPEERISRSSPSQSSVPDVRLTAPAKAKKVDDSDEEDETEQPPKVEKKSSKKADIKKKADTKNEHNRDKSKKKAGKGSKKVAVESDEDE